MIESLQPADADARQEALNVDRSFIVQAPAGSGKTELLIQRILALLAVADSPEEILAITFTRKAAGEMKGRLLDALENAVSGEMPTEKHKLETWQRARKVLQRDRDCDWNLPENPARLQIMTIDSFCSSLSRRMPWLARLGEQPGIVDDADDLYQQAAENLLARLESDAACSKSIEYMLQHLDNRMSQLRQLMISMLARRDQWIRHLIDEKGHSKQILEKALEDFVIDTVTSVRQLLGEDDCRELLELAFYAATNLTEAGSDHILSSFDTYSGDLSETNSHPQWLALSRLLLTGSGSMRKRVDVKTGFPPGTDNDASLMKERMQELLRQLSEDEIKKSAIENLRDLPAVSYDQQQWQALQSLINLLPLAVVELREVFKSVGKVDFVEVAGSARAALGSISAPEDLLLQLDNTIRHILVDEYQDTSYTQHSLLQHLTAGWEQGDGRTLFVVGDPMQSIYRFREADVGLFLKAAQDGIEPVDLRPLLLTANFRSQEKLVDWFNDTFPQLFPANADILTGAVPYATAAPVQPGVPGIAVSQHYYRGRSDKAEAEHVLEIVQASIQADPDGSIAVLVRSRNHLLEIIRLFNTHGLRFQAQDLDLLSDRPVAHDIVALTRALLHPGDAVAWFSLLRAPWCGMELNDLLALADNRQQQTIFNRIFHDPEQGEMFNALSHDGSHRLQRVREVLSHALSLRGCVSLRQLVESSWLALGGPAVVDEAGLADAEQLFSLLDQLDNGGDLGSFAELERGVSRLHASPDPTAGPNLQVMTIHKAKGLEFDTVILPGLGRIPRREEKSLLRWIEHPEYGLLLAPVPPADADEDESYRSIGKIMRRREEHETLRLFYVATTRAKKHLHLLGHLRESSDQEKPDAGSLLAAAWSGLDSESDIKVSDDPEVADSQKKAYIRRLPADWQLPDFSLAVQAEDKSSMSASELTDNQGISSKQFSLRSEEGRLVGVVVHHWLEVIANQGLSHCTPEYIDDIVDKVKKELSQAGVPADRLQSCADRVVTCLENIIASEKGRWILDSHPDHACEKELSGVVDGDLVHASIDRTFLAADVRWVIDYKSSSPAKGDSLEDFLRQEADHYRPQLVIYTRLFSQLDPGRPTKGALYFPAIDAWKVVVE